ncbi:MAG TPA: GNAT family N-acetyltransferase [Roseiarcus sp.]|jgi:GNAT superfamily N-acetyltransferase|nr:GNAT family N-acetyltransferase [Roseiarcus sp.]
MTRSRRCSSDRLAVDKDYQGQGHAADLMQYALKATLHVSKAIGAVGVLTHPLDEAAREFTRQFDFEDLSFDPRRAMIVRRADLERQFGEGE